jgi:DnaJ family protein A protein 3
MCLFLKETYQQGAFVLRQTCRKCRGSGNYNKNPCTECEGTGNTVQRRTVTVPVPAGIENGQTLRLAVGKKEVYVTFKVADSPDFRRDGADVYSEVAISIAQAVLGGVVRVPGVYEDTHLQVYRHRVDYFLQMNIFCLDCTWYRFTYKNTTQR